MQDIDGLPELGHGAVQERAGVGHTHAEHFGDLGVDRSAWNLSAISSRSRAASVASAARTAPGRRRARPPRRAPDGGSRGRGSQRRRLRRARSSSSAALRTIPNSHARGEPAASGSVRRR